MAAINFPDEPVDGQIFEIPGRAWQWSENDEVWKALFGTLATLIEHGSTHQSSGTDAIEITPTQVTGTAVVHSDSRLTPAGVISQFAGSTAPAGYLLCLGQELAISSFGDLYAVVQTNYGTLTNGSGGAGTTHFRLPNLQGRIPVGRDSAQTEFDLLGETGGAKTHTLTTAEMPSHTHVQDSHNHTQNSHNHSQNSHNHTIGYGANVFGGGSTNPAFGGGPSDSGTTGTTATNNPATATNNATTATNQNTGGGGAHNNLQPYIVVNYIIKT
jgi:microcystin-dependent protein